MSGGPFLNENGEVVSMLVLFSVEIDNDKNLTPDNYASVGPSASTIFSAGIFSQ